MSSSHHKSQISPESFGLNFIYGFTCSNISVFVVMIFFSVFYRIENDHRDLNPNGKRTIWKDFNVYFPKFETPSNSDFNFSRYLPLKPKK